MPVNGFNASVKAGLNLCACYLHMKSLMSSCTDTVSVASFLLPKVKIEQGVRFLE